MRILAADTSTASGSLALLDGENLTAEWTLRSALTHNRRLLRSIDSLLQEKLYIHHLIFFIIYY